jgi:hypothetical protein
MGAFEKIIAGKSLPLFAHSKNLIQLCRLNFKTNAINS